MGMAFSMRVRAKQGPLTPMKMPHTNIRLVRSITWRLLLPALLLGDGFLRAEADPRAQKLVILDTVVVDAAKTHTLFMGADISVNLDKDLYPVRDVAGTAWVIEINGKDKVVSAKKGPLNLKITPTLKLTEVAATIVGFKKQAAYSYENDPSVLITKGLSQVASINADLLAVAANAQHMADAATNKALGPMAALVGSDQQFGDAALRLGAKVFPAMTHPGKAVSGAAAPPQSGATDPLLGDGQRAVIQFTAGLAATAQNQALNGEEPTGRLVTRGLDALDVEFDIASAKPLGNPYIVTMARIRTPGSKPGMVQNHVYARALDPIDKSYSHVAFTEEGFPSEYELLGFQVHIYNRGVEIATNLAANRVELTREEAFEYVKMEYVSAHKGDTLAAVPAMGRLPAELPTRIASGKYPDTFFVQVSKDGIGRDAFDDRFCTRRIEDPFLAAVVRGLRFKPALSSGIPVDGVAAVNLSQLQF